MGNKETILCPYCATLFRFDPRLSTGEADPPDSLFATGDEAEAGLAPKERNRLMENGSLKADCMVLPRR